MKPAALFNTNLLRNYNLSLDLEDLVLLHVFPLGLFVTTLCTIM